ncbi:hypothetical protein FHR88_006729 [Bradyrhizobium betae]|nr:hypothetical protein [Bradyrhizobium betae]
MNVFVLAVDEGSLTATGRKLGRSEAAVSRAIAFLEERVGAALSEAAPTHLICPQGRLSVPKSRGFADFAAPRLKKQFAQLRKSIAAR